MHQEGNKSGAHRESICFHLHGRTARMESRRGRPEGRGGGERKRRTLDGGGTRRRPGTNGERVSERRGREIPRAIYGMVIEILRMGPAFAKHARTRDLPSQETATPHGSQPVGIRAFLLFFLGGITHETLDEQLKDFGDPTMLQRTRRRDSLALNGYICSIYEYAGKRIT